MQIHTAETLSAIFHSHAHPAATMLIDRGGSVSRAKFVDESRRVAHGLAELGVGRGDRVAVWLPNIPAWLITLFALARLGAIAVSINTRFRSHEVADLLHRSGSRVLLFWPDFKGIDFAGILAECGRDALGRIETIVQYDEAEGDTPSPRRELLGKRVVAYASLAARPAYEADNAMPQSGCVIFTTSGTTQSPKLVLHDQQTIMRHTRDVAAAWRFKSDSLVYLVPPFCGVYGFCTAMAAAAANVPLFMRPVWDPERAAEDLVAHRVTHITGTDEVYAQLLAYGYGTRPYPSIEYAGFASFSPALNDIVARADARSLKIAGLYGASEVQALFALRSPDAHASERMLGGGMPASSAARVRARDPATGIVLPHGEAGELEIYAPNSRAVGYFGDEDATATAFTDDGYYRSGDLGYSQPDGSFVYLARIGDSMRLGGFLVSPAEIESVVQQAPGVETCQVIAISRPEGVRAVAFVIARQGERFDEQHVVAHVTGKLAPYKVPVRVFAIDAFPVTTSANGTKIQKNRLREQAVALLSGEG